MEASFWDVAGEELPEGLEEGSVDVVLLIFVFSALSPQQWAAAKRNVWRLLRPAGEVCFRDYGKGDLAQVRFKKGRWMEGNFYVRGDGTRVYFFGEEELKTIWKGEGRSAREEESVGNQDNDRKGEAQTGFSDGNDGTEESRAYAHQELAQAPTFEVVSLGVDRRLLINRQRKLKMYRCWMQGRFRKSSNSLSHGEVDEPN